MNDPAVNDTPPDAPPPSAAGHEANSRPKPELDPSQVAILIPTLNEEPYIEAVVRRLMEDPIGSRCPIVVADGGSADRTREIVTRLAAEIPTLRLLDNPKKLQSAAMNLALGPEFDGCDILIRCDAHARYPANFVSDLAAALTAREAASVVVPLDAEPHPEGGCFHRGLAWVADTKLGAGGSPHRGGARSGYEEHGHHAAFRMSAFRALGGYDESFVANEDAEYDRRLIASGERIWLDADIRKVYFPRRTPRGLWRQYHRYGIGRARTCFKHGVRPAPRQMIPVAHVGLLTASALALPFGGWAAALGLAWPAAYLALIVGAGGAIAVEKRSACGLQASLALAVMHLSWGLGFLRQCARELAGGRAGAGAG